jgi:hypothetical protein
MSEKIAVINQVTTIQQGQWHRRPDVDQTISMHLFALLLKPQSDI